MVVLRPLGTYVIDASKIRCCITHFRSGVKELAKTCRNADNCKMLERKRYLNLATPSASTRLKSWPNPPRVRYPTTDYSIHACFIMSFLYVLRHMHLVYSFITGLGPWGTSTICVKRHLGGSGYVIQQSSSLHRLPYRGSSLISSLRYKSAPDNAGPRGGYTDCELPDGP